MTARVQHLRLFNTNQNPPPFRAQGELWVNYADLRLGFIDPSKNPQELLAVRRHATTASYAVGDHVLYTDRLYRAQLPVSPSAFAYPKWQGISDRLNLKDYGAKLDGVSDDNPAFNALLAEATVRNGPEDIVAYIPGGVHHYTWGGVTTPGPAQPMLWIVDGVTDPSGVPMSKIANAEGIRAHKGDIMESFHRGMKFILKSSTGPDSPGVLRLDHTQDLAGGTPGAVTTALLVNTQDCAGSLTSLWGIHVSQNLYSDSHNTSIPPDPPGSVTGNWPQHVGISSSIRRMAGTAWVAGIHVTAADYTNVGTSTPGSSGFLGMEIGHHANGDDDGGLPSAVGQRLGIHLGGSKQNATGPNVVFGMGYNYSGDLGRAVTKSCFGVSSVNTYQVYDARTAVAPAGYGFPIAALRMSAEQIIDFKGASTATKAGWIGPPGAYLQYTSSGNDRLRYMVGTTEAFSITDIGGVTALGAIVAGGLVKGNTVVWGDEGSFLFSNASLSRINFTSDLWRFEYNRVTHNLTYVSPVDGNLMTLFGGDGSMTLAGPLRATIVVATEGNVAAAANVLAGGGFGGNGLTITGSGSVSGTLTAGAVTVTGVLTANSASITNGLSVKSLGVATNMTVAGTLGVTGTITGGNLATASGGSVTGATVQGSTQVLVGTGSGQATLTADDANARWKFRVGDECDLIFQNSTGILFFRGADGTAHFSANNAGDFTIAGQGWKPGGGSWADTSDRRIKHVTGPYTRGLDDLLKLKPVTYRFKGNDVINGSSIHHFDRKLRAGLVAQDAEEHWPELVTRTEGLIDSELVDDIRLLDPSDLTYAIINALRTLNTRMHILEDQLP